ncbi:MAG TPA: Hsp20/alpha crystallin family protein [Bradyrhizobium sp.]|nr:Hsp20/alpha crystallin family protein [Bradyrhizobium sp.]
MAETPTKLAVKGGAPSTTEPSKVAEWRPFDSLRGQVDRLLRDFERGFLQTPFYRDVDNFLHRDVGLAVTPAIDIVEKDNAFEVTAELPGLDANNIDLQLADGVLMIKGEKTEEKQETAKDRYVSERRYGSFRRTLRVPESVDPDKIEASYKSGVLTITLPKSAEAKDKQKTIPIKAA